MAQEGPLVTNDSLNDEYSVQNLGERSCYGKKIQRKGEKLLWENMTKISRTKTSGRTGRSGPFSEKSRSCYGRKNLKNPVEKNPGQSGRSGRSCYGKNNYNFL